MATLYDSPASSLPKVDKDADDVVTINFVEDGLSAFGKVWLRGEELSIQRDSDSWEATCDRNGDSWIDLDQYDQYERFGKEMFRPGPWAGRSLADIDDPNLSDEDRKVLKKAADERAQQGKRPRRGAKKAASKPAESKAGSEDTESPEGAPDPFLDDLNKEG